MYHLVAMLCQETLGAVIHADTTWYTRHTQTPLQGTSTTLQKQLNNGLRTMTKISRPPNSPDESSTHWTFRRGTVHRGPTSGHHQRGAVSMSQRFRVQSDIDGCKRTENNKPLITYRLKIIWKQNCKDWAEKAESLKLLFLTLAMAITRAHFDLHSQVQCPAPMAASL